MVINQPCSIPFLFISFLCLFISIFQCFILFYFIIIIFFYYYYFFLTIIRGVNVQPYSGSPANFAVILHTTYFILHTYIHFVLFWFVLLVTFKQVYTALLRPHDRIMGKRVLYYVSILFYCALPFCAPPFFFFLIHTFIVYPCLSLPIPISTYLYLHLYLLRYNNTYNTIHIIHNIL
jgi:hypothetical protein